MNKRITTRNTYDDYVRLRGTFGCLGMVVIGIPLICYGLISIPQSNAYQVSCSCRSWPTDDAALEAWLDEQPGVIDGTVRVERIQTNRLKVVLKMAQDWSGEPPFPDLESKCAELGYDLGGDRFEDVDR